MNEYIYKRKSVRKYESTVSDPQTVGNIQKKIDSTVPLFSDSAYSVEIACLSNPSKQNAPHYLLFCGEDKDDALENIGFIGQQISLYLSEIGIGSCWRMGKPGVEQKSELPYVICLAFGKPAEPLFRETSSFDRKALSEISEGSDSRIEAARLAPSGLNA
jgi:hypothetical protein